LTEVHFTCYKVNPLRLAKDTDFPYENGDVFVRAVDYINDPQIAPDAARDILDHNASTLLGIG
jgi:hypothetical protein